MKNIKITFAIVMAVIAISIIGLVPVNAATANPFGPGQPSQVLTSAGTTNGPNAALNTVTNGLYPQAIGSAITTNNLVMVQCSAPAAMFGGGGSPNGVLVGNSLALQFSAQATAATGSTNTATFVLYSSVMPPSISVGTNGAAASNANPMQVFDTVVLLLNGTTTSSTNKVYTSATTPAKGATPFVYIYSIGCAAGATLTNYSVWANGL